MQNLVYVTCPQCEKPRLIKPEDNTSVNMDVVDVRGESRYVEVCNFCLAKFQRLDEEFVRKNLRKLQRAAKQGVAGTDHKDFSLDI